MTKQFTVSVLGTLPPVKALSSYCFELTRSLSRLCEVEFISFKKIYPAFLYPGGKPDDDHTYPEIHDSNVRIRRRLAWYDPFSWMIEGLTGTGDLLHAQWWSMPLFPIYLIICACFKLKKKPVIFTVHNVVSHEKQTIYLKLSKILFRLGDHFIVHSHQNKQQMMDLYDIKRNQISIIPHGSLDLHVRPQADRAAMKSRFGFSAHHKVILLFGAIRPYKGLDTAIRAFAQTVKNTPESRLLIAGRLWEDWAPYHRLIGDLNLEKDVITHLDYISSGDVHQFFEVADLCIFPYHHFDSQSGAGAAALSFRKPMIVSNVGGLPELVRNRRYVVPPGDAAALADAMIHCLQNPLALADMAKDAENIAAQFAWPEIARKTLAVYENALSSSLQKT